MSKNGVQKKMLAAQRLIQEVPKTGYNSAQNYHFRTVDDVLATCKAAFDEVGLLFYPASKQLVDWKIDEVEKTGKGGKTYSQTIVRVMLLVTYYFQDPEDGSYQQVQAMGEGVDFGGDKAVYKAETGAQKYVLTQALNIPCEGLDAENYDTEGKPATGKARGR